MIKPYSKFVIAATKKKLYVPHLATTLSRYLMAACRLQPRLSRKKFKRASEAIEWALRFDKKILPMLRRRSDEIAEEMKNEQK